MCHKNVKNIKSVAIRCVLSSSKSSKKPFSTETPRPDISTYVTSVLRPPPSKIPGYANVSYVSNGGFSEFVANSWHDIGERWITGTAFFKLTMTSQSKSIDEQFYTVVLQEI